MLDTKFSLPVAQDSLAAFCRQYGVKKLSVFGSILRDDFDQERSDVDILVEFADDAHKSLFKLVEMEQQLANLIGRRVDLTTPDSLSKYFRNDVVSNAVVLYDAA